MINTKITKSNGEVVTVMRVLADDEVMIVTRNGQILRIGSEKIRATGRSAQGVRLVNLDEGDVVAAAVAVPRTDEIDPEDEEPQNGGPEEGVGEVTQPELPIQ